MINRPTAASTPTRKMIICASRMLSPLPWIFATKKSRRPLGGQAAAEAGHSIAPSDGAAQPSTPRDAARERDVTPPPANDERKPAIVTTTSRKRLRLLRAEEPPAQRDDGREAAARMRAWLERAKWGHGPSR